MFEMTLDLDWLVRTFADVNWSAFTIFRVICCFPFFFFFLEGVLHIPVPLSVKLWGKSVFVQLCLKSVLYVRGKCLTIPQQTGVNDACFMELKCDRRLVVMIWYCIMWMHILGQFTLYWQTPTTADNHQITVCQFYNPTSANSACLSSKNKLRHNTSIQQNPTKWRSVNWPLETLSNSITISIWDIKTKCQAWCLLTYFMSYYCSTGQGCFQTQNQSVDFNQQLNPQHQRQTFQLRHCE